MKIGGSPYRQSGVIRITRITLASLLILIVLGKPIRNALALAFQDTIEMSEDNSYQEESENDTEEIEEFEKTISQYVIHSIIAQENSINTFDKFLFSEFSPRVVLPPPKLTLL